MIDPTLLRQILEYDPDTGKLFWKERPKHLFSSEKSEKTFYKRDFGNEALTAVNAAGYRVGSINNKLYRAHRVIWAIVYGEWPDADIDHANGDRCDNRLSNLRLATRSQNLANSVTRRNGFKGVFFKDGAWRAQVSHRGVRHVGARRETEMMAARDYMMIANRLYGDFARSDELAVVQ